MLLSEDFVRINNGIISKLWIINGKNVYQLVFEPTILYLIGQGGRRANVWGFVRVCTGVLFYGNKKRGNLDKDYTRRFV